MAVTVRLYNHTKKINSTAKPAAEATVKSYDGVMLDGADMLHPRIAFRTFDTENAPFAFNYAYIEKFSKRYYYIDNWVFENGRWVAFMSVDVLASYRDDIGASEQYILRSATKKDSTICDVFYPATTEVVLGQIDLELAGNTFYNTDNIEYGTYVVGVINKDDSTPGSVSYYAFTPAQIRKLSSVLMGSFDWLNISGDELSEELTKALVNPFQYIVSCTWFPMLPTLKATITSLPYGWWVLEGVECSTMANIKSNYYIGGFEITPHVQADNNDFTSYLYANPYTTCRAVIEPWGSFDIPLRPSLVSYSAYCDVDFVTGKGVLNVEAGGMPVVRREALVGVPVQLSQMFVDVGRAITNAVGTVSGVVGSAISGNFGGAISSAVSGIYSTMESATPNLSTKGVDGCFLAYGVKPYVIVKQTLTVEHNNVKFGSPYSKTEMVCYHSGYVLCCNPSIELADATPSEIEAVNNYLSTGFFYE